MFASAEGHLDVVHELLEREAKIEVKSEEGLTALMLASSSGESDIVKELLERGANI